MLHKALPFLLIISLFVSTPTKAQKGDSLVKYNELVFVSDFEKQVFGNLYQDVNTVDVLTLLLASYPAASDQLKASTESKINQTVAELRSKATNKSAAKNIKLIHATVHDRYFRKYELENNFGDIFTNGYYNCVSATALYGLVLTQLNIPFSVKETPNHVYLIAYPTTDKILLESTDPTGGYFQLNNEFINSYLHNLLKAKLISKLEYESSSKIDLFNKHYFSQEEDISLKRLAGIQYYNTGIYALSKEKYQEAYQHFAKAQVLYPSNRINYLLQSTVAQLASQSEYKKASDGQYLVMLSRFNSTDKEMIDRKVLLGEFIRVTEQQLINRSNYALYDQTYQLIKSNMKDTSLLKDIDFVYNYEIARISLNNGKTEGVQEKLDRAYQLNPQNADIQSMITAYLFRHVSKSSNSRDILATLQRSLQKYPFLQDNENVTTVISNCYLDIAAQFFAKNNLAKGEENLSAFEKLAGQKAQNAEEGYITRAFIEASTAYFRVGNYAKSKQALNRGLKFSPDNFMLKERLAQLR